MAPGPAIRSNAAREDPITPGNDTATMETTGEWLCASYKDALLRASLGLETYRYEWAGNFTNISPVPWLGAFHWSDLLMIFGTYMLDVGEISELEVTTSRTMQDYLLAFLKDPATVSTAVGWPAFNASAPSGGLILEFGNTTAVRNVTGDFLEAGCWDSSAPFRIFGRDERVPLEWRG